MAVVLDATPGGATSNSYATRAEGDAYHAAHLWPETWNNLPDEQKDVALVHATRVLDEEVAWLGTKTTREQALRWPRTGVPEIDPPYYIDPTIIPVWLKNATAELARQLAVEDRTADPDMLEYKQITVGSLSLTKDENSTQQVLPNSVLTMVEPYGSISSSVSSGGMGMMKLMRA